MKPVKPDKFLDKYKEFESVLRENGDFLDTANVANYEEYLKNKGDTDVAEKFRYLRTMRNLLVHVPEMKTFVCVCEEHIEFLDERITILESINGTVKDQYQTLTKFGVLMLNDTLLDAAERFSKGKTIIPVVDLDKNKIWYLEISDFLVFLARGEKLSCKISKIIGDLCEFSCPLENGVSYSLPLNKIPEHSTPLPVIKSGSQNKIVGFLE